MTSPRAEELTRQYEREVALQLAELRSKPVDRLPGIRDFAEKLFVHPGHLSNTLKKVTGRSPCDIYEEGLVRIAEELLVGTDRSIASIAHRLTMDPSNFTKFFKRFKGCTPSEYRARTSLSGEK